jgi:hypothetical protein
VGTLRDETASDVGAFTARPCTCFVPAPDVFRVLSGMIDSIHSGFSQIRTSHPFESPFRTKDRKGPIFRAFSFAPRPIHFSVAPTVFFFVARCFFFDAPTLPRTQGCFFVAASSRTLDASWFLFDAWTKSFAH